MDTEKVICETPTPGKKPTRIDKWKYNLVHDAILKVVPSEEPGMLFTELTTWLKGAISEKELDKLGSLMWYTTTVKLDMETKGELIRLNGSPQRLIKSS